MTQADSGIILRVDGLSVGYRVGAAVLPAVRDLSFTLARGEVMAVVGESGSGKSTLVGALTGLLPENAVVASGSVTVGGYVAAAETPKEWNSLRGKVVGLIPQDPGSSLNPTMTVGAQLAEALRQHRALSRAETEAEVLRLLGLVGLDRPKARAQQYPHVLSGGMRQRVLVAIAMAGDPQLIVADEPTSALDATVQKRVLDHLERLVVQQGLSLLIVTHDLGVAADRADRILVMRDGREVESGAPAQLLRHPAQEYTRTLIAAAPAFQPEEATKSRPFTDEASILEFHAVSKAFSLPGTTAGFWRRRDPETMGVLSEVSFAVPKGGTLALVGESGSGKTTALRIALGLERPSSGQVLFDGQDLVSLDRNGWQVLRQRVQFVQQNPFSALDPRYTVYESIVEPLLYDRPRGTADLHARARHLVDLVHLPQSALNRLPRELSGGQRQRVAIARALALDPELLVLDEPVSALDVSVQAQIMALLRELQRDLRMSYLFVSHDLAVVSAIADRIVVINQGRIVDQGTAAQVFGTPRSDHTRALIEAIPGRRFAGSEPMGTLRPALQVIAAP